MYAVEINNLVKTYGPVRALDKLSLTVEPGRIFGFLGRNGAGKTTTVRILAGLARPTSGSVKIFGEEVTGNMSVRRRIGYTPDVPAFYGWMTASEYLEFAGGLFGLSGPSLKKRVNDLLETAGLSAVDRKIAGFSRGMRQRLGIAQAFIADLEVLFLDEPTSALDPIGRREVLEMIRSLGKSKTVFFSTHILADVERVCDHLAIVDQGKTVVSGSLDELRGRYAEPGFLIEVDSPAAPLVAALTRQSWVTSARAEEDRVTVTVSQVAQAQREIAPVLAGAGAIIRKVALREPSLEEIFIKLTAGEA